MLPVAISELNTRSECETLSTCGLMKGDILIKRELSVRTNFIARVTEMYFTHAALYVGDGGIVEAPGYNFPVKERISLKNIVETSWAKDDMEAWLVLRPITSSEVVDKAVEIGKSYASNPDVEFGITKNPFDNRRLYCSQLVWKAYYDAGFSFLEKIPEIITPDDIFYVTVKSPDKFLVLGWGIN